MQIDILTLFPEVMAPYLEASILGRASEVGVEMRVVQLRDFASGKHKVTDDTPFGGGAGMVMMVEPIHKAIESLRGKNTHVILTSASAKLFTQEDAKRLALEYEHIIFICGRYEGVDERVEEHIANEAFSIGEYVLTGGELPALVMTDAIVRNVPGVLGNEETLYDESHDELGKLEYPQYTQPRVYNDWAVPRPLLSGDHGAIAKWREEHRKKNKHHRT
ncbi:tRNA (guanosine(37)-N1)-methyltransferase TrmD [Candidatus Uhrbacteria bacterium RIFCSPLOWO2_02_FULL_53_10]|uniref:tRNA (guanine-N(1)-)-methyltransferase n=1 Tax=Candidatus Uhrbacteria bacterium RIFCSPLOWO2_02_FULL_53_10 TaxID=1802411 RepID=A0A1F7VGR2_9BACT|nr:MAG: tRNA (guanosine(37)-N1)-methyltransferase TrmD [Candidatus Uhrbacteria bacterium RIFCSPLOWO2_02_FULL_53_10]